MLTLLLYAEVYHFLLCIPLTAFIRKSTAQNIFVVLIDCHFGCLCDPTISWRLKLVCDLNREHTNLFWSLINNRMSSMCFTYILTMKDYTSGERVPNNFHTTQRKHYTFSVRYYNCFSQRFGIIWKFIWKFDQKMTKKYIKGPVAFTDRIYSCLQLTAIGSKWHFLKLSTPIPTTFPSVAIF